MVTKLRLLQGTATAMAETNGEGWIEEIRQSELPPANQELLQKSWMEIERQCQEDLLAMLDQRDHETSN